MKILKIVLISFVSLIVVLCVAAVIVIKTFNVNKYKPQIIEQARNALNRDINFEKISLDISFTQGICVNVSDLVIGESPEFGTDDFFRVKRISLAVDVLGYLTQKKVNVPSILIDSPRVTIIRTKDGRINAASFGKPADASAVAQEPAPKTTLAPSPLASPLALPAILVSSFKIDNGAVTYVDKSFEPALSADVTNVIVLVKKFSLSEPFSFSVEASVLSEKKNIKLSGNAQLNMKTNEVTVSGFTAGTELSEILLEKIPQVLPMTKDMPLPQSLKGKLDVTLDTVTAGPQGLGALKANVAFAGGVVQLKELLSPVKDIGAQVKLTQSDVAIDKVSLALGDGTVTVTGSLKDYPGKQTYSIQTEIKNLKIQDIVSQEKAVVQAEGIVSGPVNVKGEGFTPEALKSTLSGTADISLAATKLKGLNVLRAVLDKITVLPGLSTTVSAAMPENLRQKFEQEDTVFSDIKLPVIVENGRIILKDTAISSELFIFKGQGEAGFDGSYSMVGALLIPKDLSGSMVSAVSQLQYLLDEEAQIYIPLKVSGTASNVSFVVDAAYIGKKLVQNQAKQQIFNALDKALGTSEGADQASSPQGSGGSSSAKEAVSSILGNIFK